MVMPSDLRHDDLMRITQVHNQIFALFCSTVTNTVDFQLFCEAVGNAFYHVGNQGSGQAVQAFVHLYHRWDG